MRTLYYNIPGRYFAETATNKSSIKTLRAKRGETLVIGLIPVDATGTVAPYAESATAALCVKARGQHNSTPYCLASTWTPEPTPESATPGTYGGTFRFSLTSSALDNAIANQSEITVALEIAVSDTTGHYPLPTLDLVIENNYLRPSDPQPTEPTDTLRIGATGNLEMRNPTTGTWHAITITGDAGSETLTITPLP